MFRPGKSLIGVRAGRYLHRSVFRDGATTHPAFRAPLIRYDDSFALTNSFLEQGSTSSLGSRSSMSRPAWVCRPISGSPRPSGLDTIVRLQGYYGAWIVGVSHIRTLPYQDASFAHGRAVFTGIDLRWSHDGVLASGEWITGRPFDGTTTDGWHADVTVHRPQMGPLTAVFRGSSSSTTRSRRSEFVPGG